MKYFLSTSGKKCCCKCTWKLQLAQKEDGYDLIQIKRGFDRDRDKMKLQPGELAIVFDTGALYIGDEHSKPMLLNGASIGYVMKPFTDADLDAIIAEAEAIA